MCVCVRMHVCAHTYMHVGVNVVPEETRAIRFPGAEVTGGGEPRELGPERQTQAVCKHGVRSLLRASLQPQPLPFLTSINYDSFRTFFSSES